MQDSNPERLQLTDKMKKEGARELRQEVLRLRMEANIGKAPPLTDEELFVRPCCPCPSCAVANRIRISFAA